MESFTPSTTRIGSEIYVTSLYGISEISNGRIFTIVGLTPTSKTISPLILMRDPMKKIIYYIDLRTLKQYDENTGISKSLSTSIFSSPAIPFNDSPFLIMNTYPLKPFGLFSTFDRKIYFKDNCRILRIDPETLNFETIIGNSCSTLVAGVKVCF